MSGKTIATIYFYLISAVSLALIIIGVFNGVNFIINSTQYDKYPTRYGLVRDCSVYPMPYKVAIPADRGEIVTPLDEEQKQQKERCEKQIEADSKQHHIEDIKNTITFTLAGIILFVIHFPLALKNSQS
ncbi:hypothetical protein A3C26_02525 [Candidatus Daviesbacteria bacterium RIFCSPHIGHO2_02_FULL_39_12]|uniref:DUF5671 domain-containing protein n=2 Tax=Candidatus Daviesiibacteriota TaxID=1752718 RepID=A0A1F5J9T3_9BACT|nr:MAG: hypothetical protein A3C26_02525 [Candidatus Daviesbacteria bacterium RIFCSPHIGHO2_02_FULL_39_12]OGE71485.1 MAG: hypothetical protein A3H40_03090 [Candidatus Daviesbacteria bacterium RIFCSPLOWO2_02_FULL_38_15]